MEIPVNYATYGSLTRAVAETLLGGRIHYAPALIPGYGLRMLSHQQMSDAERAVMQGASRFIAVVDKRNRRGIYGGVIFGLPREEATILEAFDNSSRDEYEIKAHKIIAIQGLSGEVKTEIPALLVARKKIGRNPGERRDPVRYDPYEPFRGSEGIALEVARKFREEFFQSS